MLQIHCAIFPCELSKDAAAAVIGGSRSDPYCTD
jgi:hypothetical protein